MEPQTVKEKMIFVLDCIAEGKIGVSGHEKGNPESLDGEVLALSDVPDGSLKKGDELLFGEKGKAEIVGVGNHVVDGHVYYSVKLNYPK